MHLTILQKWLINFLKFFFSKKGQKCISLILIGVYMFSIPYNISYLRAYLMLFLPMIFGKWLNQLDIFSFLTVGMLMYNPYLVYNLSFIFSYLIYFFILLFTLLSYISFTSYTWYISMFLEKLSFLF